jgi:hypothetical protein
MAVTITLSVEDTDHFVREDEAKEFCRTHVVIRQADIDRIGSLAKKLGFLRKLKALNIKTRALGPRF